MLKITTPRITEIVIAEVMGTPKILIKKTIDGTNIIENINESEILSM